jgi:ribosomal-protein-alanine N-acetyltransferase
MSVKINESIFNTFPELESERLFFRRVEKKNASDIFLIRSNKKVLEYMDSDEHQTIDGAEKLIKKNRELFDNKKRIHWVIIEKTIPKLIGDFRLWRLIKQHCRSEIGYLLKPEFWDKGYMRETMTRIIDFTFNDFNIHSIEANINPSNKKSERLLVNFGFNDKFIDSIIYSLLKKDVKKISISVRDTA